MWEVSENILYYVLSHPPPLRIKSASRRVTSWVRKCRSYYLGGVKGSGCRKSEAATRSRLSSVKPSPRSWAHTHRLARRATPEKAGYCCWSLGEEGLAMRPGNSEPQGQTHCQSLILCPAMATWVTYLLPCSPSKHPGGYYSCYYQITNEVSHCLASQRVY